MKAPSSQEFLVLLNESFKHEPTSIQQEVLEGLSEFVCQKNEDLIFLLKGYAGTGKTTTIGALVKALSKTKYKIVLLAPTGRAAKVITKYSNRTAFTIHKKIYYSTKKSNGAMEFVLQKNKASDTIFVVDEASMISDSGNSIKLFEDGSLLDDLMQYIYNGKNCKLMLIGDTAQLPPVKQDLSPALDSENLIVKYDKDLLEYELTQVVRQQSDSGILYNATTMRQMLSGDNAIFDDYKFDLNYKDVNWLEQGDDIQDAIETAYSKDGVEDTVIIVRSNKRANQYNQQIRTKIKGHENEIAVGDYIMVVKNNYFWIDESSDAGFIANGDICEVTRISKIKELYGYKFAEATVRMIDYKNQQPFDTVLLLDTLTSESASLSYEESNKLYQEISKDYSNDSKYQKMIKIKANKFFNALQVKFAYAMTCHKSQGGQWGTVFVEKPYLPDGPSLSYYRWLYTAVTRAEDKLNLIGFKANDFKDR
ncbi:MAG: AAA family ATPase [Flavobacteriaceae bacterium]|nr:AAA family ATPase [Flavobacteriaceae bacterium]